MLRVGQKVTFVRDESARSARKNGNKGWPDAMTEGRVVTIRDIDTRYVAWYGVAGLRFEELSFPPKDCGPTGMVEPAFPADQFRPVVERKTDISIFTALLNPSRVKEAA